LNLFFEGEDVQLPECAARILYPLPMPMHVEALTVIREMLLFFGCQRPLEQNAARVRVNVNVERRERD
jgi:hypothetical protein